MIYELRKFKFIFFLIFFFGIFGMAKSSFAADYYIAQSAAGLGDATSCANAKAISYLTGSWSGKISAGDIVHLCGTFTFSSNTIGLTIGASGSSGSPITIKFEPDAIFQAPYFGAYNANKGAIYSFGKNYIIIDGGTNGIIQNTTNGTELANQQDSTGISIQGGNNIEIKNLTIQNIYIRQAHSDDFNSVGTGIKVGDVSTANIHDNIINNARFGIVSDANASNQSGLNIYNNDISLTSTGVVSALDGAVNYGNINIYNNTIRDWSNMDGTYYYLAYSSKSGSLSDLETVTGQTSGTTGQFYGDDGREIFVRNVTGTFQSGEKVQGASGYVITSGTLVASHIHCDGIHTWGNYSSNTLGPINIYNNTIGGEIGTETTSLIYLSDYTTPALVYNNLLYASDANHPWDGYIGFTAMGNGVVGKFYNNTIVGNGQSAIGIYFSEAGLHNITADIQNNIFYHLSSVGVYDNQGYSIITSDHNDFYNNSYIATIAYSGTHTGGNGVATLIDSTKNWLVNGFGNNISTLRNITAGNSYCHIISNTATTATCTLTGGTRQTWNTGDVYELKFYAATLAPLQTFLGGCPGAGHECNSVVTQPPFTSSNNWHLIGAFLGSNLSSYFATDRDGAARSAWDIGAYEYVSDTTDTTPPAAPTGLSVN